MGSKFNFSGKSNFYLFVALSIILFLIVFFTNNQFGILTQKPDFSISDTSRIQTIKIEGKDTLFFEKTDSGWMINQKYPADQVAVQNLVFAFSRIEIIGISEMPDHDIPSIIISFSGKRLKHQAHFSHQNNTPYMFKKGSDKIYEVKLSGVSEASLKNIIVDERNYWLDKILLDLSSSEIRKVKVKTRSDWGRGFIIENQDAGLVLKTLEKTTIPDNKIHSDAVTMYLSFFRGLYYESVIEDRSKKEQIKERKPEYVFFINDIHNNNYQLEILPIIHPNGERDLFFAWVMMKEKDELYKVNYVYLDLIMQTFDDFTVK